MPAEMSRANPDSAVDCSKGISPSTAINTHAAPDFFIGHSPSAAQESVDLLLRHSKTPTLATDVSTQLPPPSCRHRRGVSIMGTGE